MKDKIAYILLMMACVVTACTDNKEEPTTPTPTPSPTPVVEPVVDQVPIGFNVSLEEHATTRDATPTPVYGTGGNNYSYDVGVTGIGDIISTNNDDKGFGVFAVYTGNTKYRDVSSSTSTAERQIVMKNQRVIGTIANNKTTWTYSPLRFWPGNASNISFFAYAPYLADNDPALSIPAVSTATNDGGYTYFELDNNNKLKAPTIAWDHTLQRDLVYGVANANVTDVNGDPIKYAGEDYTDMRRPSDGTLHWKLKHPLARAKFTIANLLQYEEQLNSIHISPGDNGNDEDVNPYSGGGTYISGNEVKSYAGHYIKFKGENEYYHKYTEVAKRLIITKVTFSRLYKSGNMALMNEYAGPASSAETANTTGPMWDSESMVKYSGTDNDVYTLAPLNPQIGVNFGDYTSAFNGLVSKDALPLNVALKEENSKIVVDDTKTHYLLLMPQKYYISETQHVDDPIMVSVTYMVCTHVQLEGNFSWSGGAPEYVEPYSTSATNLTGEDATKYDYEHGNFYIEGTATTISGPLQFDIVANKTYNIVITLGKVMNVTYEITDWDDTHTINIPAFE